MSGLVFTASSKSADAPDVEAGMYDALFTGVAKKFVQGGQYGDGDRFEWAFHLLDDDGDVLYEEREDNPNVGDPIEVTGLTSMSTNTLSKTQPRAVRYLKALLTPGEFASFEAGEPTPEASTLFGRKCQVEVAIRDSGWPTIANVLPARKARKARTAVISDDE
jgi:hypothetical protein